MKTISLIGSTGSIGKQTLDVCRKHNIKVKALAALKNVDLLEQQAREFLPEYVCIYDETYYKALCERLSDISVSIITGMEGLCKIASLKNVDLFVNSVVGMVGLLPTLTAIENGTDIALANKETLVAGGNIVMRKAEKKGVKIYPIDSEHSAIFQCLQGNNPKQLNKIILTASGGPFWGKKKSELENVTVEQALNHPNWSMGNKITIDSATLMNKGLEFIEAKWLFGVKPENIEIVVNRESVLHSAVEFDDYSVIAQMGTPDMKIPIQYALLYPERFSCDVKPLSLTDYGTLTFGKPDYETFDCLSGCIEAIKLGGAYPCIVNAVNEEAVALFLERKIPFLKIGELVKSSLEYFDAMPAESYEDIKKAEASAREYVYNKTN
ncbi:MAG: 1-deoxy-D-xylulose-5-phosphate reductoisomerase [Oscillospiraceae bacterium]|nr:1-deoxy-D-xylulose-5-phosphate reductoisomerase [Oscillospiraceae bacterium]